MPGGGDGEGVWRRRWCFGRGWDCRLARGLGLGARFGGFRLGGRPSVGV